MTHTPGPLTIKGPSSGNGSYDDGGDYAILNRNGHIVGEAFKHLAPGITADAQANALLFAAAPDLLEACRKLLEEIHEQGYDYFNSPILGTIEDAQEAIAKAEGKEE